MGFTMKDAQQLLNTGKIRGFYCPAPPVQKESAGRRIVKHFAKRSEEKNWIAWNLWVWAQENGIPLIEEKKFDSTGERKFRFDWSFPDIKVAIEYEGIMSEKSGHTTVTGYNKDAVKYNLAQSQGWKVIRLTALNYKDLLIELKKLYEKPKMLQGGDTR